MNAKFRMILFFILSYFKNLEEKTNVGHEPPCIDLVLIP